MSIRIAPDKDQPSVAIEIPLENPLPDYDLERLWRQAPSLVLPDEPGAAHRSELSEKAG